MNPNRGVTFFVLLLTLLSGTFAFAAGSQGIAGLDQAIRDLGCNNVVMAVAVQPEGIDADTLAYLRMNRGARTIAVIAGWGQGCGREDPCAGLYDGNSQERVEEVLAAADALGCEVVSLDVTGEGFDLESAVEKLVRLIRLERPDPIITRHSADRGCETGRGMGTAIEEAVRLAGDPEAFPEQIEEGLSAWGPTFLLERTGRLDYRAAIPVWEYDPIRGTTYAGFALEAWPVGKGRAEAMRAGRPEGMAYYRIVLPEMADDGGVWELAVTQRSVKRLLGECLNGAAGKRALRSWDRAVESLAETSLTDRGRLLKDFREAGEALDSVAEAVAGEPEAATCAKEKGVDLEDLRRELDRAVACAVELRTRIVEAPDVVYSGGEFDIVAEARVPGDMEITVDLSLDPGPGMESAGAEDSVVETVPEAGGGGTVVRRTFHLRVPEELELKPIAHGPGKDFVPKRIAEIQTEFALKGRDGVHRVGTPVMARKVAPVRVDVVPESPMFLLKEGGDFMVEVQITNHTDRRWPRSVSALRPPEGFTISRQEIGRLTLLPGQTASVAYWVVSDGGGTGVLPFRGMVVYGLREGQTYQEADPGQVKTDLAQLKIPVRKVEPPENVSVGVVRTCGDVLTGALRSLDVPYRLLEAGEIASASLDRWDVILIDAGAYSKRPEVARHRDRFIRYLWRGGHMVVFGQSPDGWDPAHAPYPLEIADATVGKDASLEIAKPDEPIFREPNPVSTEDLQGWEGPWGRYFGLPRHEAWVSLIEAKGNGTPEGAAGMLLSRYGYGSYVYVGLDLERQLEAGHPGAYRLFANLIDYPNHRVEIKPPESP